MLSGVSFRSALNDLGRFIANAQEVPRETRRAVDNMRAYDAQAQAQIVAFIQTNKEIYVSDVAVAPHTQQMISFLM